MTNDEKLHNHIETRLQGYRDMGKNSTSLSDTMLVMSLDHKDFPADYDVMGKTKQYCESTYCIGRDEYDSLVILLNQKRL